MEIIFGIVVALVVGLAHYAGAPTISGYAVAAFWVLVDWANHVIGFMVLIGVGGFFFYLKERWTRRPPEGSWREKAIAYQSQNGLTARSPRRMPTPPSGSAAR